MPDRFTSDTIQQTLGQRPFRFFEQISSTQDAAREWALSMPSVPGSQTGNQHAVVIAEEQIAGRGRQDRRWHALPGSSIMCSVILKPTLDPEQLSRITLVGTMAVAETLVPLFHDDLRLKWPNDVLIRDKKICGILAEAIWNGDALAAVVLGIGLNVRVDFSEVDLIHVATSIESELGKPIDRLTLLHTLLSHVDYWAGQAQHISLFEAWQQRLGTLGKRVTVYLSPGKHSSPSFSGVAEAVDENGALCVRLDSGERRCVVAADVGLAEN